MIEFPKRFRYFHLFNFGITSSSWENIVIGGDEPFCGVLMELQKASSLSSGTSGLELAVIVWMPFSLALGHVADRSKLSGIYPEIVICSA